MGDKLGSLESIGANSGSVEPPRGEMPQGQLSWAEQHETAAAIEQFSVGLWRIFIGSVLLLAATAALYGPLMAAFFDPAMLQWLGDPRLQVPMVLCSIAGIWIYFSGKQHCLAFALPVQKRYLLTGSLACDVGAFICRMIRDVPGIGPPSRMVASLLVLAGFLLLLAFFVYLARLIGARGSAFMGGATGLLTLFALGSAFLVGLGPRVLPPDFVVVTSLLMVALLILAMATYLILTATLSFQLRNFGRFLKQSLEAELLSAYDAVD